MIDLCPEFINCLNKPFNNFDTLNLIKIKNARFLQNLLTKFMTFPHIGIKNLIFVARPIKM